MSDLGKSIIDAIDFIASVHKDVSKLIGCVDDSLRGKGLDSSIWGSTSVWDRSAAYHSPNGWMPRYLCRVYVPTVSEGKKFEAVHRSWAFFIAYLTPKLVHEPTAVWGVVTLSEAGQMWPVMRPLLLRDDGPAFLKTALVQDWQELADPPENLNLKSLRYRASPLVSLTDADAVDRIVITPLDEAFQR
ncbi:MAG TPA: hypothetical protein VGR23_06215 [Candidatus Dormibacteraeota bacterium]|jgi:hypothetical protein|nr:hypothetical protein [Candidatus Dormibacteraeota bacterium]